MRCVNNKVMSDGVCRAKGTTGDFGSPVGRLGRRAILVRGTGAGGGSDCRRRAGCSSRMSHCCDACSVKALLRGGRDCLRKAVSSGCSMSCCSFSCPRGDFCSGVNVSSRVAVSLRDGGDRTCGLMLCSLCNGRVKVTASSKRNGGRLAMPG